MFQNAVDFNSIKPEHIEKETETELEEEEEEEEEEKDEKGKEEEEDPLVRRLVRLNTSLLPSPSDTFSSFFTVTFTLHLFLSFFLSRMYDILVMTHRFSFPRPHLTLELLRTRLTHLLPFPTCHLHSSLLSLCCATIVPTGQSLLTPRTVR